ncbi:MAG: hypothetical protein F7B18_08140 [Desulfurococcales archaeon]|nr:hypothetical protein [Desulfurococcales archaeon]
MAEEREETLEELMPERPKGSISKLLEAVPPASALKAREKRIREKRIRLRYDASLQPEQARINQQLAKELGVEEMIEVVVAGRHRFVFYAIIDEDVDYNSVHVNPDLMEEHGVADRSIATVRAYKGTEQAGVRLNV